MNKPNAQLVGTVAPEQANAASVTTYNPAIYDCILGGTYGRRAMIQSLAVIVNSLGFSTGISFMPRINQQEETQFDESTASFYGIDGVTPKKRDVDIVACGFVSAQLLLVNAAMQPDPENYGKNHEWAKTYFRDAKRIASNIHDWAMARKVRQEQATAARFARVGTTVDITARTAAIAAEVAAMSESVLKQVDELLRRQYVTLKDTRDDHEALWENVVKAYDHIDISLTRVVNDGLKMMADSAAKRFSAGGYATIDDGVLALMEKIAPTKRAPVTLPGVVVTKTVEKTDDPATLHIAPPAAVALTSA